MEFLYNLSVVAYNLIIHLAALTGNKKARQWVEGRKDWDKHLKNKLQGYKKNQRFWFHCASLGEFEQGRPLIEKTREEFPEALIILSFFSPSGFEIRKNYNKADIVTYLPADTPGNAKKFISIVEPDKVIFVKYEFWYNYIHQLSVKRIPLYVVSAIFRPDQIFFKSYGGFFRDLLRKITLIFVQDKGSVQLLETNDIPQVVLAGDTRFDRVQTVVNSFEPIPLVSQFCAKDYIIVGGSTWAEDESILLDVYRSLEQHPRKLILVPHEPDEEHIGTLLRKIATLGLQKETSRLSTYNGDPKIRILIVDSIGHLSKLYHYAHLTFVGGGFGKGIHNILEAAAHGKPVFFGPTYGKFREAHELLAIGGAFTVQNSNEATVQMLKLVIDEEALKTASRKAGEFVKAHTGATQRIFDSIFPSRNAK